MPQKLKYITLPVLVQKYEKGLTFSDFKMEKSIS